MEDTDKLKTPGDILKKALEKEREAYDFYNSLSQQTKIEMVRRLVDSLKDEEAKHARAIEQMIAKLNRG
jgi:rubrerythrin